MPELPEVETIRRGIAKHSVGATVKAVHADDSRMFRHNVGGSRDVQELVSQRTIASLGRRGKFMWLAFEDAPQVLVVHLGMSGKVLATSDVGAPQAAHEHLRLELDPTGLLQFIDPRTFGHLTVSEVAADGVPTVLSHIAPDPFESAFDVDQAVARMRRSRRTVKTLLLDQGVVSGIGNIYADEALFRASVPGWLPGSAVADSVLRRVLEGAAEAMSAALEVGGTSFDSLYVDAEGNPGYFSRSLAVYGKRGEPCVRCSAPLERVVLDGRSHFYCPRCQGPPDSK